MFDQVSIIGCGLIGSSILKNINDNQLTYQILRKSISKMIMDIYENTRMIINKLELNSISHIRDHSNFVVSMSKEMNNYCLSIRDFLFENVYNHKNLLIKRRNAEDIIIKLFKYSEVLLFSE